MGNLLWFASVGAGCLGFEDFGVRLAVRIACRSTANTVFYLRRVVALDFRVLRRFGRWIPAFAGTTVNSASAARGGGGTRRVPGSSRGMNRL